MPKLLEIVEREHLPLLLLFGENHELLERLVHENAKKFRIILSSQKKPSYLNSFPAVYFVPLQSLDLLPKLEEKISYALIFLPREALDIAPVLRKLKLDRTKTVTVGETFLAEMQLPYFEQFKQLESARIALLGELLIAKSRRKRSNLSKIIENVILNREIRLAESELQPVNAVSETDALLFLNRLLLGNFKTDTMHYLFYKTPQTILEASHIIGRLDPEIKIHFSESNTPPTGLTRVDISDIVTKRLKMNESYIDPSKERFEKEVAQILETPEEFLKSIQEKGEGPKKVKTVKKSITKTFKYLFLTLLFGTFLFLFVNLLFFGLGIFFLQNSIKNIESSNFKIASENARLSNFFLYAIKPTIHLSFDALSFVDLEGRVGKTFRLAEKSGELSEIAGITVSSLLKDGKISEQNATSAISNFAYLYQEAQRIVLETNNKEIASHLKNTYSKLLSLSSIVPTALGYYGEKNYLLLFQNNEELRPTGGFIGSIGDVTVKNGEVERISIQDVYEIDGQLRRHYEPPYVVRRYLQPHLYLRDSNFSLNFQEAASQSAIIYNLVTEKRPDAVIAIDLTVLKEILKITGPISLPSYNVTVDHNTISSFIQGTIEGAFFPGSTQKRDILNAVMLQLIEKSKTDSKFYISVAKLVPDLLEQKHILVSFQDNSIQKVFSANGYGGEFSDTRSVGARNINDFLLINEANIGVNKANADVTREVSYRAMVGTSNLVSKASIKLINKSTKNVYKTYIHLLVPKGSVLSNIKINGALQEIIPAVTDPKIFESENFIEPSGLEVEHYTKDGFTHFAFVVNLKPGSSNIIEVDYQNGAGKNLTTVAKYSLIYIKQPGTDPYLFTSTIDYPEDYTPVDTSADSYGKNYLEASKLITTDFKTEVELQRKKR